MQADALVAEIGSTITKVHAFAGLDTARPVWLGSGTAPTTVRQGDVTRGLREATADLARNLGEEVAWRRMLAASSAAGGLRMTVHGLVHDMTVRAAREAALGAGAILDLVTSGKMGPAEVQALREARPGIILLAGGVEGGDREVAVHNARAVAEAGLAAPVIYAGNSAAGPQVVDILRAAGRTVTAVPNVYPRLDQLDIEPARRAIQEVFEAHIVRAPGMEHVREMVAGPIRPTPGAVMESAVALREILGDLVVLDVGGATTDVHSVTGGAAEIRRIQIHPEPVAKRTVEGDLGVYVNAPNVVRVAGAEEVARYLAEMDGGGRPGTLAGGDEEVAPVGAGHGASRIVGDLLVRLTPLPSGDLAPDLSTLVEALARIAAETALLRHAGRLRHLFGPTGRVTVAEGKDLTEVEWIVGTGGPLTRFPRGLETLSKLARIDVARVEARGRLGGAGRRATGRDGPASPPGLYLLPSRGARPLLDKRYIMAILGVLRQDYPEAALRLLRDSIDGRS